MPNSAKAGSYKGIVAVGKNKDVAMGNFRRAVLGQSIASLSNGDATYIVNQDDLHAMFNPSNGELDLETIEIPKEIQKSLSSLSSRMSSESGAKVEANYMVCADGCGSHIVYEQDNAVDYCPVCATTLIEPTAAQQSNSAKKDDEEDDSDDADDADVADDEEDDDSDSEDDEDSEDDDSDGTDDDADSDSDEDDDPKSKLLETIEDAIDEFTDETEANIAADDSDDDSSDDSDDKDTDLDSETDDDSVEASATKPATANTETKVKKSKKSISNDTDAPQNTGAPKPPVPAKPVQEGVEVNPVPGQPATPASVPDQPQQPDTTEDTAKVKNAQEPTTKEAAQPEGAKPTVNVEHADVVKTEDSNKTESNVKLKGLVVAATTFERARALYRNAAKGKGAVAVVGTKNAYLTSVSDTIAFDPASDEVLQKAAEFEISPEEKAGVSDIDNVEYKICEQGCGSHVLASVEVKNCPVCSTGLVEPTAAPESTSNVHSKMSGDDMEDEDTIDDEDDEDDDQLDEDDEDSEDDDSDGTDDDSDGDSDMDDDEDSDDELDEDEEDEDKMSKSSSDAEDEVVNLNLMDAIDSEAVADDLSVSFVGGINNGKSAWVAFHKGAPVAYATESSVGKNADIFADHAFGQAVIAGARKSGVKAILGEMGFQAYEIEASVKTEVAKQVQRQVAEAQAQLDDKFKQYGERFQAAMATAAIGINRGFYQNVVNPVKVQFYDSLSTVGVTDAEVMIDNVFQSSSDSYHKLLLEKTNELLNHTPETQEELAKSIMGMGFRRADGQSVSAAAKPSFGSIGEPKQKQQTVSAAVPETNINERNAKLLQKLTFGKR